MRVRQEESFTTKIRDFCRKNIFTAETPSAANIAAIKNYGSTIVAVGVGGVIWRARGIPAAFAAATSGTANDLNDVAFAFTFSPGPTLNALVVGAAGTVLSSTSAFATWTAVTTARTPDLTTIAGDGAGTWLTGGSVDTGQQIWSITESSGTLTMTALTTPAGMDAVNVTRIKYISGTTYIVATDGAGVWRTTDTGANWTQVWAPGASEKIFSFGMGGNKIIAGGSNSLETDALWLESTDDGATWSSTVPSGTEALDKIWYNDIAVNAGTWSVPNKENHGLYSLDDGDTFTEFPKTGYFGIGNAPVVNYVCTELIAASTGGGESKDLIYVYGSDNGIINYSLAP